MCLQYLLPLPIQILIELTATALTMQSVTALCGMHYLSISVSASNIRSHWTAPNKSAIHSFLLSMVNFPILAVVVVYFVYIDAIAYIPNIIIINRAICLQSIDATRQRIYIFLLEEDLVDVSYKFIDIRGMSNIFSMKIYIPAGSMIYFHKVSKAWSRNSQRKVHVWELFAIAVHGMHLIACSTRAISPELCLLTMWRLFWLFSFISKLHPSLCLFRHLRLPTVPVLTHRCEHRSCACTIIRVKT